MVVLLTNAELLLDLQGQIFGTRVKVNLPTACGLQRVRFD